MYDPFRVVLAASREHSPEQARASIAQHEWERYAQIRDEIGNLEEAESEDGGGAALQREFTTAEIRDRLHKGGDDYRPPAPGSSTGHPMFATLAAYRVDGAPEFQLMRRFGFAIGIKTIDFPSHPRFSKRFRLMANDGEAVRRLFSPAVLSACEALGEGKEWQIRAARAGSSPGSGRPGRRSCRSSSTRAPASPPPCRRRLADALWCVPHRANIAVRRPRA